MTKDKLRQYRHLAKEVEKLQEEINRIRSSLLPGAQVMSDMPRGGQQEDKMASVVALIVDTEEVLREKIRECIGLRLDIEHCISILPSESRQLMRLRYIDGYEWEKICVELNYSWRHIHRKHSDILQSIILA